MGIWGINQPVGWGFDITNLVWWIGIGHAGTLISAILFLFRQEWRTSINRFAEAMTLFAVSCALLFPVLHVGRPWLVYWLFPYPNTFELWPQFRSPLVWDAFAISTYAAVSFMFWFVGLIPDLAAMRDRAENRFTRSHGMLALGWARCGPSLATLRCRLSLAGGVGDPFVVSVHSVVSFDFAVGVIPGWHSTVFPPYFVGGAIFSGFAMVMTLLIPLRKIYHFEDFITAKHLDNMAKVMLATGLFVVSYGVSLKRLRPGIRAILPNVFGSLTALWALFWRAFAALMACNVITPQRFGLTRSVRVRLFSFVWRLSSTWACG